MCSTGFGRFGDYEVKTKTEEIGSGGRVGDGVNDYDLCSKEISNIKIEDVATSDYYTRNKKVPIAGADVELLPMVKNGRLVIALSSCKTVIGNLPSRYNYLRVCSEEGFEYVGEVVSSGLSPIPYIMVDLHVRK